MAAESSDANLGDVVLTTGGAQGNNQLVKVEVQMQLKHEETLASDCYAYWTLTRDASAASLGTWSQGLSNATVAEERNVAFSFATTQPAATTSTYHILGSNTCTQILWPGLDVVTAEAFPLNGTGAAPARGGVERPSNPETTARPVRVSP